MNLKGKETIDGLDEWSPEEFKNWVNSLSEEDQHTAQIVALGLLMDEDEEGFSLGKQRALIVYAFNMARTKVAIFKNPERN